MPREIEPLNWDEIDWKDLVLRQVNRENHPRGIYLDERYALPDLKDLELVRDTLVDEETGKVVTSKIRILPAGKVREVLGLDEDQT